MKLIAELALCCLGASIVMVLLTRSFIPLLGAVVGIGGLVFGALFALYVLNQLFGE